jgi:acetylornithine deacetylase/succinyl-diaminopimelate desuccinylase-like protein
VTSPDDLVVSAAQLGPERETWLQAAWAEIDHERLRALTVDMVGIPSPTGEERALAEYLAGRLGDAGLHATYQPIDPTQGNAVGRLPGAGDGPDLLLYAPIDTLTAGNEDEDVPWVAPALRDDMRPQATVRGDWVVGLGAGNPKGHGACVVAAAEAVRRAGIPLRGDLWVGLGAGGMPTNKRPVDAMTRYNAGQGNGCSFMLEQGLHTDYAIIAKPGWSVAWEEVGLCWFKVQVRGTFGYVGARHRIPYTNAIVDAGAVATGLEAWFAEYAARNTSGLVAPQGQIGAVEGGWTRTASLSPAVCNLYVDLRISPRTTPVDARRQFVAAMTDIAKANPGVELDWEMTLAIPGTSTPPDTWIVQSCARAWERVEGRPHQVARGTSGATDANILRLRGIPTARVGMPKLREDSGAEVDFALGMNAVGVTDMARLTRLLVYAIIDTCGRRHGEPGDTADGGR